MDEILSGRSVLIADDEDFIRSHIAKRLRSYGMTVWEAGTGEEVLRLIREGPDLIIMDVKMPGMDGCETTRAIRKMKGFYETPIILLSARAQKEDIQKGKESGASDYMTKPVTFNQILEKIIQSLPSPRS